MPEVVPHDTLGEVDFVPPSALPPKGTRRALAWGAALVVSAAVVFANLVAFHPDRAGTPMVLISIGAVYGAFGFLACVWLARHGALGRLRPERGDITIGALVAATSYLLAFVFRQLVMPRGSPREAWIMLVYAQAGDPRTTASFAVGLSVLGIAALEEIVWRGWIMPQLSEAHGDGAGLLITTALYALVHAPTVVLLSAPHAGPNPLVVLAAAALGLLWGVLVQRFGRLGPALFAHAFFTWAIIEFRLWQP